MPQLRERARSGAIEHAGRLGAASINPKLLIHASPPAKRSGGLLCALRGPVTPGTASALGLATDASGASTPANQPLLPALVPLTAHPGARSQLWQGIPHRRTART